MSPGPLTSFARGGFGYGRNQSGFTQRFAAPLANRNFVQPGARQQKFYVDDGGIGHFEPGDKLVLQVDDDGGVTIALGPPKNGNGNGNGNGDGNSNDKHRSLFGRRHRMAVSTSSDGEVAVRPEGDGSFEIVGDPLSGAITIVELPPEPLNSTVVTATSGAR